MKERGARVSVWLLGLAGLAAVASCLIVAVLVYQWVPDLPGTLGARMDLDRLSRVVVPGSREIAFAERGTYAVYYEYHSEVGGVTYTANQIPPALACGLTSEETGEQVAAVPDYVPTNTYATREQARAGVLIQSITIDEPGTYLFSCHYPDGRSEPEIVLAVGPNFVWEFFGIAAKAFAAAAAGLVALVASGALAALLIVFYARHQRSERTRKGWQAARSSGSGADSPQEHTDLERPKLFAWLASLTILLLIASTQVLAQGDNPVLRGAGVVVLGVAGVFIFAPFFLLGQGGPGHKARTYMQADVFVDRGLYATIRHPQYLGYMLLSVGFALLSQQWVAFLLAATSVSFFYLQAVREERYLLARFGEAYEQHLRRVPRFNFLLGVWRRLKSGQATQKPVRKSGMSDQGEADSRQGVSK